jgi:hypothetical protein
VVATADVAKIDVEVVEMNEQMTACYAVVVNGSEFPSLPNCVYLVDADWNLYNR